MPLPTYQPIEHFELGIKIKGTSFQLVAFEVLKFDEEGVPTVCVMIDSVEELDFSTGKYFFGYVPRTVLNKK